MTKQFQTGPSIYTFAISDIITIVRTVAIIQARLSSIRLPGKVMYPLDGTPVIKRIINRVQQARTVDEIVVATTTNAPDDLLAAVAREADASVFRGSEPDVLGRLYEASEQHNADTVVRICADSPLVDGHLVDKAVRKLTSDEYDYVSNKLERTVPVGIDVEAFTKTSFETVEKKSTAPYEREHVTVYYRESPKIFSCGRLDSSEIFGDPDLQNRTDLRVTLDEPEDYRLLNKIFVDLPTESPTPAEALHYIDQAGLAEVNDSVKQKSIHDAAEEPN